MALTGKKVLMVLPPQGFDEREFEVTRRVLEGRGLRVELTSTVPAEARGHRGMHVRPTVKLDDVKYYDYDAIIFIGGDGARDLAEHEKATKLAKDAEYKVLGAIGQAPAVLARAKVVKGKRLTADPRVAELLRGEGAQYTFQPVEVADKLVTAQGRYAEPFAHALLKVLEK